VTHDGGVRANLSVIDVVLADDAEHFRRGLVAVLATEPDLNVVGEAADGAELVDLVERLAPDVAVVDLRMPGIGGLAAIATIHDISPITRIVVLTVSDDDEDLLAAIAAGAHGYLLKDTAIEQVPPAIREVVEGGAPLSPAIAAALWAEYTALLAAGWTPVLRPPEVGVLRLMSEGASAGQISTRLDLPPAVVAHELRDLLDKVHLVTRVRTMGGAGGR
jgi:DNA-binding NarL/FixJ family response regulator